MDMTPERWTATTQYINALFGQEDEPLRGLMARAVQDGLPDIAVDAGTGRVLSLLCAMTNSGRGAKVAIEVGTLAGYSAIWIARALAPGGRLYTIEAEPKHAAFARRMFVEAGVSDRVEVIEGKGLDVLPALINTLAQTPTVDFVFLDAVKTEYPAYFDQIATSIRPSGLLVADNTLGSGRWWIDALDPGLTGAARAEAEASRRAADELCRTLAGDPRFESAMIPIREGLLVGRRRA